MWRITEMLKVNSLVKSFGGLLATDNLSFEVEAGEIHAFIGPNGAGKTTLISQITGEIKPDSGTIEFDSKDISYIKEKGFALIKYDSNFIKSISLLNIGDSIDLELKDGSIKAIIKEIYEEK